MVNNYLTGFMGQSGVNTYNPRYPGLNEKSYNLLRQQGQDNEEEMDKYYKNNVKGMLNNQKLDERETELNQVAYQNANINNGVSNAEWRLTKFSQDLKRQYNLKADANDVELFTDFVSALPNGAELADAYLGKGNMDLYKAAGLETAQDRLNMGASKATGGRFGVVNQQLGRTSILPDWRELVNPIGYATETLDNGANVLADKITVTGEKSVNNLQNKINNLSDKDIEEYRKIYNKMVANRDIRTQMVEGDTIVEQLRDGLTDWIKGTQEYGGDEEAFRKRVVQQEANLGQSLIGADDTLNGVNSPNVIKFFANLPESGVRTLTATLRGKTNPMDTYKGLIKLVGTKEGRQVLKDRYGSWDAIADLMNYDPVGTADDLLAVVDTFNSATKLGGKAFGSQNIAQNGLIGNYMPDRLGGPTNTIGSAVDATVDVGLNGGKLMYGSKENPKSVDVSGLYGWMDNVSKDNKILNTLNTYLQDTSSTSKLWEDTKNVRDNLKKKAVATAENIIQNDSRMKKGQQEKFKEMTKEDQGKWQNDRDIRTNEDKVDYFERSKKKVDDAMDTIEGTFKSEEVNKIINGDEKLEGIVDYARDTEDPQLTRLLELQQKNNDKGLTMSEINEVKRYYERKQKMGYYKDNNSKKLDLATNRDTALREWQFKTAEEAGLDNLKQLNKETQAAKYIVDNTIAWESGVKGNNPIKLSDWIVMAGGGISKDSILGVVGKNIFTSSRFQNKIVDVLNYLGGHEKMDEINPNIEQIKQQNAIRRAMIEELQKVQNEQDFQKWLNDAKEIYDTPRLPYNGDTVEGGYSTIVSDANGNAWTKGANAEIDNRGFRSSEMSETTIDNNKAKLSANADTSDMVKIDNNNVEGGEIANAAKGKSNFVDFNDIDLNNRKEHVWKYANDYMKGKMQYHDITYYTNDKLSMLDTALRSNKYSKGVGPEDFKASYTLGEILDNPELYKKYPSLKDKEIVFVDFHTNKARGLNMGGTIFINSKYYSKDPGLGNSTIVHEIEHEIQRLNGSHVDDEFNTYTYRANPNEIGARNKQKEYLNFIGRGDEKMWWE